MDVRLGGLLIVGLNAIGWIGTVSLEAQEVEMSFGAYGALALLGVVVIVWTYVRLGRMNATTPIPFWFGRPKNQSAGLNVARGFGIICAVLGIGLLAEELALGVLWTAVLLIAALSVPASVAVAGHNRRLKSAE